MTPVGRVVTVCVTTQLQARTSTDKALSGINKGPVDVAELTATGVVGDQVRDRQHHGGVDKAVYAYAQEDAAWWADQLGEPIPPGRFGENLHTQDMDLTAAVIGERWQVGEHVVVEVSEPRTPCATFRHHMGDRRGWVRQFSEAGRVGTYLRVLVPGEIRPGDPIALIQRPVHGVTVGGWYTSPTPEDARALLAAESDDWQLSAAMRWTIDRVLTTAEV